MLEILDQGPFVTPTLVVALDGWVNAGSAGTLAAEVIAGSDAVPVARFDSDLLYDYRMLRPSIDFQDGVLSSVAWPQLSVTRVAWEGRDILVMTGSEPNWNWQRMCGALVDAARAWGVVEFVGVGGVPWAAPHTRPVTVMTTSTSPDRLTGVHPEGLLRVPGAAVSAFEHAMALAGVATIGFWARVPNYVGAAFPAAALAVAERVGDHLGLDFDTADLAVSAKEQRTQLDDLVAQRADVSAMVEQLEQLYDTSDVVSGEDLAAEIERFLRDQR
ncbi:MAG: PAC2 family protein [Acidimicrobiia bacterium]|nr:PAC2 family protein [Acidimicrobiia bacterium]MDH4306179.1 PAC2 family protein [Acidimicrobiia bacterium]MDH5292982.1 PAC2 family protein [Acidimicrobiia bacterium]